MPPSESARRPKCCKRSLLCSSLNLISLFAGFLAGVDSYMNIKLSAAEEWVNDTLSGPLGDVLIRCNNVLYVRKN